ncbi:MAG: hypothetical protein L6R42_010234, partial [Xanthoria sp. 1 TBL-2021]
EEEAEEHDHAHEGETPAFPAPTESVGCEAHGDHYHCAAPASAAQATAPPTASGAVGGINETSAGTNGTSAGTTGTSAGTNGTSAGTNGTSAVPFEGAASNSRVTPAVAMTGLLGVMALAIALQDGVLLGPRGVDVQGRSSRTSSCRTRGDPECQEIGFSRPNFLPTSLLLLSPTHRQYYSLPPSRLNMPEVAQQRQGGSEAAPANNRIQQAIQAIGIFFLVQFVVGQFLGNNNKSSTSSKSPAVPAFTDRPAGAEISDHTSIPQTIAPIWPMNSSLDLSIYVSPSLVMPSLKSVGKDSLVLEEKAFALGDWKENRQIDTSFKVPKEVQKNGTLWAHFYVALHGHPLDPAAKGYDVANAYHFFHPLNHVIPKKKFAKTRKLVGSSDTEVQEEEKPEVSGPTWSSYYHPNFTMSFIPDSGTQNYVNMHPAIRQYVHLESSGARDASGQNAWYYPILFVNTFWQLRDHMTELNSTVKELPLHINLNNLANWKFSLYSSIGEGAKQSQKQAASGGPMPASGDGSEFEAFKRILLDTNVYLLATTAIVTVLHMVFEGLAFKSDISHWRNKKDNVGISFRTILANVFMQT